MRREREYENESGNKIRIGDVLVSGYVDVDVTARMEIEIVLVLMPMMMMRSTQLQHYSSMRDCGIDQLELE